MIGLVDDAGRALIEIAVGARLAGERTSVTVWIDTAFDGHLVFSRELIEQLQLDSLVETEATLADGSTVTMEAYICYMDWFGDQKPLHVIANEGRYPLLGIGLLDDHILHIDYKSRELQLE